MRRRQKERPNAETGTKEVRERLKEHKEVKKEGKKENLRKWVTRKKGGLRENGTKQMKTEIYSQVQFGLSILTGHVVKYLQPHTDCAVSHMSTVKC